MSNWEKKFRELVEAYGWEGDLADDGKDKFIINFITNALNQQREKLSKEIAQAKKSLIEEIRYYGEGNGYTALEVADILESEEGESDE